MPTTYLAPGVYIDEIPSGARPIEAVGTSTAAFVGVAPEVAARPNEAMPINNWTQFKSIYTTSNSVGTPLAQAVYGFFLNGGTRCYVVNIGQGGSLGRGLEAIEAMDEVAIVAAPGYTDAQSYGAVLDHCELLQDRVAILDAPEDVANIRLLTQVATAQALRKPRNGEGEGAVASTEDAGAAGMRPRQSDRGFGAFYFPWVTVQDAFNPRNFINVPPSGHIAGIYARTDTLRGVHKAPANEAIRGALNLSYRITRQEQEVLNPVGVNCIRLFPNEGIRVWGARTLAASASEWRYINVRRLFNMIEESIARSTRWVVFEPNNMSLWKSIRRDVNAFLTLLWRQGALMGATPEEAFFVRCDAETNPPEVIDAGQVMIEIGIAPVKPAEFVIFRISQGVGGAEIEVQNQGDSNA